MCPACGYSLEGLPAEGICPECGGRYDQAAIILHGFARGTHAGLHNGPPWILAIGIIWPVVMLLNVWKEVRRGQFPAFHLTMAAIWFAGIGWLLRSRWNSQAPGLVRVRLDATGCRQEDNPGRGRPTPATPWAMISEVLLKPSSKGRYRLRLRAPKRRWHSNFTAVDAEVQLTPKQAEMLRQWLDTSVHQAS
jgi:hypothetical protein